MKRPVVLKVLAGGLAAAALAAVWASTASSSPRVADDRYEDPTQPPAAMPSEAAMHQRPDGTWESRLLPFAKPFPTKEALERALADARREGLIQ